MDHVAVIREFSRSYYHADELPRPLSAEDRARAKREFIADPHACILENIAEAQRDLREVTARFRSAESNLLFERDTYETCPKKLRSEWLAAADVVRGDYQRARSELAHWHNYAQLAIKGKLKLPKSLHDLADQKALTTPEEDAETNRQKRAASEALAQWSAAQRTGDRVPGEDDMEVSHG